MESADREADGVCTTDFNRLCILEQLAIFCGITTDVASCNANLSRVVADQEGLGVGSKLLCGRSMDRACVQLQL